MQLLRSPDELARLIAANAPAGIIDASFDAIGWLTSPANFALVDGDDLTMWEATEDWPGPLTAHVFFQSRGKRALEIARAMISRAFDYGATRLLGETPMTLPHAQIFARRLGFRPYGEADRPMGRVILSALENPNPFRTNRVA